MDARVENLLAEPLGTLDGVTVLGVAAVITGGRVSAGTGTVAVADADGETTSTAPGQPYFFWAEAVAPRATSGVRTWRFHVPKTATAIDVDLAIVGDFPAELSVAVTPPDSTPAWFADDSSWSGIHLKGIVVLDFKAGTSVGDRQLAVALVGGTVVGGIPDDSAEGAYLVQVTDDGSDTQLAAAIAKLQALSQVSGRGGGGIRGDAVIVVGTIEYRPSGSSSFEHDSEVWSVPLHGGTATKLWTMPGTSVFGIAISEDGAQITMDIATSGPAAQCFSQYWSIPARTLQESHPLDDEICGGLASPTIAPRVVAGS